MSEFKISDAEAGERLDKFLVAQFAGRSRGFLQRLVKEGVVQVNGKTVAPHLFLKVGDVVSGEVPESSVQVIQVEANSEVTFEVLAETPDYVVINKPAGVVVHQSESHAEPDTLVNGLLARYPELIGIGDDKNRPGMVHRLDQDVSGVMVVARTAPMFTELKRQFHERTAVKEYIALVHGVMSQPSGQIDFPIARSTTQPNKMAARPSHQTDGARDALTDYGVEEQFQHYSLLRVKIYTGRTHQIRVHLNAISHPIVGDEVYKPDSLRSQLKPGRVLLHAQRLTFQDLSGAAQTVEAPIPADFQTYIDKFRGVR